MVHLVGGGEFVLRTHSGDFLAEGFYLGIVVVYQQHRLGIEAGGVQVLGKNLLAPFQGLLVHLDVAGVVFSGVNGTDEAGVCAARGGLFVVIEPRLQVFEQDALVHVPFVFLADASKPFCAGQGVEGHIQLWADDV